MANVEKTPNVTQLAAGSTIGGASVVSPSTTDTFTNKTFDANGTGNSLSNVDVADLANGTDGELITWDAAAAPATVAAGTSGQVLTSNGVGAAPTFQAAAGGTPQQILSYPLEDVTRYTTNVTGSGAVTTAGGTGFMRCSTGTTDASKAELHIVIGAGNDADFFNDNPEMQVTGTISSNTTGAFVAAIICGSHTDPSATGALTSKHFGFILDSTVLDASNANGSTQTTTDISSGLTLALLHDWRIVSDSGTNHKFYVSGVLKATHTTNLASGDLDFPMELYIKNDVGDTTDHDQNIIGVTLFRDAE